MIMNALICCLASYLNPANHHPARITKTDQEFAKRLDFNGIKFPVKIRNIQKIEKRNSIGINVFRYVNREKHPSYVSKQYCEELHVYSLLTGEEGKRYYFLIKDFNAFIFVDIVYNLLLQKKY